MPNRSRLPLFDNIQVASPCSASWDDMKGDDRVRFCGSCEKNVYNLSAMPRAEAEALVNEREGSMCVRFYRREDGTVLTADCPVGVRRKRVRRTIVAAAGATAMAAAATSLLFRAGHTMGEPMMGKPVAMGTVAVPAPPPVTGSVAVPPSASPTSAQPSSTPVMGAAPPDAKPPRPHTVGRIRARPSSL